MPVSHGCLFHQLFDMQPPGKIVVAVMFPLSFICRATDLRECALSHKRGSVHNPLETMEASHAKAFLVVHPITVSLLRQPSRTPRFRPALLTFQPTTLTKSPLSR